MIELVVLEYLSKRLEILVVMERIKEETFVLVQKTSGSEENHIGSAMIAVQSYAKSMQDAAILNERIKNEMKQLIVLNEISAVHLNSDYPFSDTISKIYRYQAVFDITHYNS